MASFLFGCHEPGIYLTSSHSVAQSYVPAFQLTKDMRAESPSVSITGL